MRNVDGDLKAAEEGGECVKGGAQGNFLSSPICLLVY